MGCPKSPMWESEGEAWSEDEDASSSRSQEGNVCNQALHVVGFNGPGDKISLFLQEWELAKGGTKLPRGPTCLCQQMYEAWKLVVAAR